MLRGAADYFHPPVECVFTLGAEEVDVVLELELEDIVLVDLVRRARSVHAVTKEGQAGQGEVVLEGFVEVETEVGKDHPELLPPVRVLELSEQISRQLVLQRSLVVDDCHAGRPMPTNVHRRVASLAGRTSFCRFWICHLTAVEAILGAAHGL